MRFQLQLEDELVEELDRRFGARNRDAFIAALIRRGLEDQRLWDEIEVSLGSVVETGHEWDEHPSVWVQAQRRQDPKRSG